MHEITTAVAGYMAALDAATEVLSEREEGRTSALPSWVLTHRRIEVGVTLDGRGVAIRVVPSVELDEDIVLERVVGSQSDLTDLLAPFKAEFAPDQLADAAFVQYGDVRMAEVGQHLSAPALEFKGIVAWGSVERALPCFTEDLARQNATELWSAVLHGVPPEDSYVVEVQKVLEKFRCLIKRKAFKERRIHRFLREHGRLLLPAFSQMLFEHAVYYDDEKRVADFVLRREAALPPLLIELESPAYKVFRKDGDLTKEANHAVGQIADWVRMIDSDAKRNASGQLSFLAGPKERLVVMGRGLEERQRMIDTRFRGTAIWSYELLLEEARRRLNDSLCEQRRLVGLEDLRPF